MSPTLEPESAAAIETRLAARARRTRLAAALVLAGLGGEAATLGWNHPTAFVLFAGVAALVAGAGMLLYLDGLLRG